MDFSQAWHMWVDNSGAPAGRGGRRITIGVTPTGAVYLNIEHEPIADDEFIELPPIDRLVASGYSEVSAILGELDAKSKAVFFKHIDYAYDAVEEIQNRE